MKLTKGKKRSVGYKEGKTSGTSVAIRVKLRRKPSGYRILRRKKRAKLVRIGVTVTGSDGFEKILARNTRFRK